MEQTLSIIKPDAVAKNVIGQIYTRFENAGLTIAKAKKYSSVLSKQAVFMLNIKNALSLMIW